jgi:hypothetical protein
MFREISETKLKEINREEEDERIAKRLKFICKGYLPDPDYDPEKPIILDLMEVGKDNL